LSAASGAPDEAPAFPWEAALHAGLCRMRLSVARKIEWRGAQLHLAAKF